MKPRDLHDRISDRLPAEHQTGLAPDRPRRVLYLTYDGIEDQLGQSQVLPYLKALAERGHEIHVISFEKSPVKLRSSEQLSKRLRWTALRYHKRPSVPATAYDVAHGIAASTMAMWSRPDIIHVRSTIAGAMALPCLRARKTALLFDTRGMWADQKVESGAWAREGPVYVAAKRIERSLYRRADAVTVLTRSMHHYLRHESPERSALGAPIHIIPTCTDLDRFSPDVPPDPDLKRTLGEARTLVYVGSFGGLYLGEAMARFYLEYRRHTPSARFLVLSKNDPSEALRVLARVGLGHELVLRSGSHDQMASLIRCAHAAVAFVAPLRANRGSAPTKLGETLACGLPTAATSVGDVESVLCDSAAGVPVADTSDRTLADAAVALHRASTQPTISTEARRLALRWFRLGDAIDRYASIYSSIARGGPSVPDLPWPPSREPVPAGGPAGVT